MAKMPNLEKLSLAELKTLSKDIDKALANAVAQQRTDALAAAQKAAEQHGFSLAELTGGKGKSRKTPVAPKYRHPKDASLTWSGRGRQPAWFKEALAAGKKPEALEI